MKIKSILSIILTVFLLSPIYSQTDYYSIKKAPFSTDKYDEFSPVFYNNGIVFSTNRSKNLLANYSDSLNRGQIKINFVDTLLNKTRSVLFSKSLTSRFNDGPVTFNRTGDTVYYSRNMRVDGAIKSIVNVRNKLGIFYSVKEENEWVRTRELRYNSEWYNITTPFLSNDGKRLYFTSDMPEGNGGSDIWYCQWLGDYWDEPVNLGPVINTPGNESYPFINSAGELFFSSDGHPGLGGKDIFFSRMIDSVWTSPVRLSEPINSPYDDFGIVTDSLMRKGFFSTNRDQSIDIYEFKTLFPQTFYTEIQKTNRYCFNFSDTGLIAADTTNLRYRWSFSDGKEAYGAVVRHCFAGPGTYQVKLDIIERGTGTLYFSKLSYTLDLRDFVQPFIAGPDAVIAGEVSEFNGLESSIPGYRIIEYTWDFGDGSKGTGSSVRHAFSKEGEYLVNMGVVIKSEKDGSVRRAGISKKVVAVGSAGERDSRIASIASEKDRIVDIKEYPNAHILTHFSDEDEIRQNAIFVVEILSSSERLGLSDPRFRVVPQKYSLKEFHDPATGLYSYVAAQNLELTDSYISFRELHALGFRNTRIRTRVLTDPFERDLYNLMRIYSLNSDLYFDKLDRLSSHAYIMLDQIVNLLNKHPQKRLEVIVHSDNTTSPAASVSFTQKRAQLIMSYLVKRGVSAGRLISKGSGSMLPIAPNILEKDRKLNRRIDFILVE